ncbi:unnamed protein product [Trichogramma brassicae]|uniref:Uncharacterized protein n=1 Tax=Trichogramma brassicae TaxID=86971 RepID=A0A6H5I0M4_9HYME|nr:unnamed protein product [Trichogramma brassicae]
MTVLINFNDSTVQKKVAVIISSEMHRASGVAWDNFDRFVESAGKQTSGKESMHDTVGIIYQSIPTNEQRQIIESMSYLQHESTSTAMVRNIYGRRKRSFEPDDCQELPPAKMSRPEFQQRNSLQEPDEKNLALIINPSFYRKGKKKSVHYWRMSLKKRMTTTTSETKMMAKKKAMMKNKFILKIFFLYKKNEYIFIYIYTIPIKN